MSAMRHNRRSHNEPSGAGGAAAAVSGASAPRVASASCAIDHAPPSSPVAWPRKVDLFGVGVSVTHCEEAAAVVVEAARKAAPAIVACQAVHAIVLGSVDKSLGSKMNAFDMITPDGQPVRWAMNLLRRTGLRDRLRGVDLTVAVCRARPRSACPSISMEARRRCWRPSAHG